MCHCTGNDALCNVLATKLRQYKCILDKSYIVWKGYMGILIKHIGISNGDLKIAHNLIVNFRNKCQPWVIT